MSPRPLAFGAACAVVFATRLASADDPPKKPFTLDASAAPIAAVLDGTWAFVTQLNTTLLDKTLHPPRPYGTIGHYSRKLLYGMSWSIMLGVEGMIAVAAGGGTEWIEAASYRTDWMIPIDMPACSHIGANGGCGLGVGNFAFLSIKPRHTKWWFEVGGGWIEQRLLTDELRTVVESSWMLTPLQVLREFSTDPTLPVAINWRVGPGLYGGMHSGSMHPTVRGQDVYRRRLTEMYPLDGGVGPGARTELVVTLFRHLTLEGDVTVAPLLLGGASSEISRAVAPLDTPRSGLPMWRKVDFGIGFQDFKLFPFKPTLEVFAAELSERRIDKIDYRGVMMRFDIPLKGPGS